MKKPVVWLFTKAKDTRNLLKISKDILVVCFVGQIAFNPLLPPPGVPVRFWINCFADIFIQAFGLYDGTKNFLIENLNYLFDHNKTPTIHDLYRLIKSQKFSPFSRFARYQESALNRLSGLINSFGTTLDYPCYSLEELTQQHVIFEIQGLSSEQQVFIVNILLTWLYYYKLNNNDQYYNVVAIDDANLVFDKSFEHRPDHCMPIISHLVSTVRKSKVFIIVVSQIPHQLGASIHSNAFTKIMFSLANGNDIDCMARSIGISDPDQLQYLHRLGSREVLIKFSGRYQESFLAQIPEFNIFEGEVSDEEIRTNNNRILSSIPVISRPEQPHVTPPETCDKTEALEIGPEEKAFLWDIYNRPYVPVTERYRTIYLGG